MRVLTLQEPRVLQEEARLVRVFLRVESEGDFRAFRHEAPLGGQTTAEGEHQRVALHHLKKGGD